LTEFGACCLNLTPDLGLLKLAGLDYTS